jgi:hypothetical protein
MSASLFIRHLTFHIIVNYLNTFHTSAVSIKKADCANESFKLLFRDWRKALAITTQPPMVLSAAILFKNSDKLGDAPCPIISPIISKRPKGFFGTKWVANIRMPQNCFVIAIGPPLDKPIFWQLVFS